jgi:hypothetical protein
MKVNLGPSHYNIDYRKAITTEHKIATVVRSWLRLESLDLYNSMYGIL